MEEEEESWRLVCNNDLGQRTKGGSFMIMEKERALRRMMMIRASARSGTSHKERRGQERPKPNSNAMQCVWIRERNKREMMVDGEMRDGDERDRDDGDNGGWGREREA
ncbi:hypothetical protein AMTR_s00040p00144720 [Amborella trichopoda]|uniref:Uncharacterized protein n=1 Tax=Amborella trichopoda TaxID=13333 RepID=W1PZP2_AMBTC|nr:hypothetical protein AMTR_s00040p00144720 [Amborella trichopoda]